MKSKLLFGSTLLVLCGMVIPTACVTTWAAEPAASTAAGRLPSDLARASTGTGLQVREPNKTATDDGRPAQALIGEDSTQTYSLAAGKTGMILSLSKIEVLNHFDFVNAGAEGKVTVSVSSGKLPFDSADWRVVASAQGFDGRQLVPCDLGSVEARYVKIDFDTHTAGSISGFNLFGLNVIGNPTMTKGSFHVSLRTGADAKMDANFSYDPADPAPKVVADLGSARELTHITCAYEAPAGHLDFYLVDDKVNQSVGLNYVGEPTMQPVSNDQTGTDDANVLAGHQVIYSVDTANQTDGGKASADLKGLTGRYLVAAFRPATRHRAGDYKDFKNARDADFKDNKDGKSAPVFPLFSNAPNSSFGNAPNSTNVPLLPPPLGAGSP